jgi:hypothetical protein
MSTPRCEDCGSILECGICSNCQEELYIVSFQGDCIDAPLSRDFIDRVEEQKQILEDRKNNL